METENFLIEFGLRVKKARLKLNMSQEELAKKSGYSSRSTINKIELGTNGVPQTKVQAIASALGVSPAYLMGWDEEAPSLPKIKNIVEIPKHKKIPIIGKIAAGTPIKAEENIEGYVDIDEVTNADFGLRIVGDSMTGNGIYDGDIVFIKEQADVNDSEIAAVLLLENGDFEYTATLKHIYHTENGMLLMSSNPKYPPITCVKETCEDYKIIGKATYLLSRVGRGKQ